MVPPCRARLHCRRAVLVFIFLSLVPSKVVTVAVQTVPPDLAKFVVPGLAVVLGLCLYVLRVPGPFPGLMVYFGAHTGMNFYMKFVLSEIILDDELRGMPMAFLMTSIQQLVAVFIFVLFLLLSRLAGASYKIKRLKTSREFFIVLVFSLAFAGNIGLNNFSLSRLAVSVNLIIRSCLPLATAVLEIAWYGRGSYLAPLQWVCLWLGVMFTVMASRCKMPDRTDETATDAFFLGLSAGIGSLFFGALNMVLAGVLGRDLELNAVDSTFYMAIWAGLIMLLPALKENSIRGWPAEFQPMTDYQILKEISERNSWALAPVFFSGILAFLYNVLQYYLVRQLSATHASFAGNFNTAVAIVFSLLLGLEDLPQGEHGFLFLVSILGNLLAFTCFTALKKS